MHSAFCEDLLTAGSTRGPVSAEILEAKIQEAEAATDMQKEAKAELVERYRKALNNLQTAKAHAETAAAFQSEMQSAPAHIQALRAGMDAVGASRPQDGLDIDSSTPLVEIEQLLQKGKADFASVDARRSELEKRLEGEADRPAQIRRQLTEARQRQEEIDTRLKQPPPAGEGPAMAESRRWVLETGYEALSAEIQMLDQELLSQAMRVRLGKPATDRFGYSLQALALTLIAASAWPLVMAVTGWQLKLNWA